MLNPYPDRIEELHAHLARAYGQRDRQATEILLCACLDASVTRCRKPWIVIETDWPNRDTRNAWFSFGGIVDVRSLAVPRVLKGKYREEVINGWVDARGPNTTGLFVDAEWRRLEHISAGPGRSPMLRTSYSLLMSQCVKLRVTHPKSDHAVAIEQDAAKAELQRLARRVLDNSLRSLQASPSAVVAAQYSAPRAMFYWCELAQKLSVWPDDWDSLTSSLAIVARNACTLYNDPSMRPDWSAAERILKDCVNFGTSEIMTRKTTRVERQERAVMKERTRLRSIGMHKLPVPGGLASHSDWIRLIDKDKRLFT